MAMEVKASAKRETQAAVSRNKAIATDVAASGVFLGPCSGEGVMVVFLLRLMVMVDIIFAIGCGCGSKYVMGQRSLTSHPAQWIPL